jgi:hypothetical protein
MFLVTHLMGLITHDLRPSVHYQVAAANLKIMELVLNSDIHF